MTHLTNLLNPCFEDIYRYSPCYDSDDEVESTSSQSLHLYQRLFRFEVEEKPEKQDIKDIAKLLLAWVQCPEVDGSELSPSSPETWSLLSLRRLSEVEGFVGLVKDWDKALLEKGDLKLIAKERGLRRLTAEQCCFLDFLVLTCEKLGMICSWMQDYGMDTEFLDSRLARLNDCLKEFGTCKAFLELYQSGIKKLHPGQVLFYHTDIANRRLNPGYQRTWHERQVYESPFSSCARFVRLKAKPEPYFSQILGGPGGGKKLRKQGARVLTYYSPIKIDIKPLLPDKMKSLDGTRDLTKLEVMQRKTAYQERFDRLFALSAYKERSDLQAHDPTSAKINIAKAWWMGHRHFFKKNTIQEAEYPPPANDGEPVKILCSVEPAVEMLKALKTIDKELTDSGSPGVTHPFGRKEDLAHISPARFIELGIWKGWLKPHEYPKNYRTVIEVPNVSWE